MTDAAVYLDLVQVRGRPDPGQRYLPIDTSCELSRGQLVVGAGASADDVDLPPGPPIQRAPLGIGLVSVIAIKD